MRSCVHCLGKDLERENVVVAVHNQSGKKIGFAENDPVRIRALDEALTVSNRRPDTLTYELLKIVYWLGGNHA